MDQYRDPNIFIKEYLGEELLIPYIFYPDMKTDYPIQVIDLRHQVDHISPEKVHFFGESREDPANARIFVILIRHSQIEMISGGFKNTEIKVL